MKTVKEIDIEKAMLVLIVVIGLVLSFALRYSLRRYKSADYDLHDKFWFTSVIRKDPDQVLRNDPTNYTPFYTYLMIAASYLFREAPKQAALKFVIIPFDYLCAFFVYKTVKLKYPSGYVPLFALFSVLFLPTVFLLSSAWGQKDFIYIAFLAGCLYFLLSKREVWTFIFFGLAFSVKLQAMFLFPLLVILWLRRYVSWKSFLIIPSTYLVSIAPA